MQVLSSIIIRFCIGNYYSAASPLYYSLNVFVMLYKSYRVCQFNEYMTLFEVVGWNLKLSLPISLFIVLLPAPFGICGLEAHVYIVMLIKLYTCQY